MSSHGRVSRSVDFPLGFAELTTVVLPGAFQWEAGPDGTDNVFLGGGRVHEVFVVPPTGATSYTVEVFDYRDQDGDPLKGGSVGVAPPVKHLMELLGADGRYGSAATFEVFANVAVLPGDLKPTNRVASLPGLAVESQFNNVAADCPHGIAIAVISVGTLTAAGVITVVYSPYTVGAQHFRFNQKAPFTIPAGRQSAFSFVPPGI